MTAGLATLASRRVPIASIRPGVLGDDLIAFVDGTCVWLEVRDGTSALRQLAARSAGQPVYLHRIEPCFGCGWYQLGFSHGGSLGEIGPTVLARVKQYESKTIWVRWAPMSRWHRQWSDQHRD